MSRKYHEIHLELDEAKRRHGVLWEALSLQIARRDAGETSEGLQQRIDNLTRGVDNAMDRAQKLADEYGDALKDAVADGSVTTEEGSSYGNQFTRARQEAPSAPQDPRRRADFDQGMRTIERHQAVLGAPGADRLDKVLRQKDPTGVGARYVTAVGDAAYDSAFGKMLLDPTTGHLRFTPAEVEAVRRVSAVDAERAMGDATGSAGGFGLPLVIDPSIVLTNAGVINPIRDISRVEAIATREWRGISSDGVVAVFGAEATEASDQAPTLVQPSVITQRAWAFIPFSIEVSQDYPGLQERLGEILADAKNVLEANKFLLGSGTNEPGGILNIGGVGGLTLTQRVQTAAIGTLAYGDVWGLKAAVPPRFLATATWLAAPNTIDTVYQLSPTGSTTLAWLMPEGRGGPLTGLPVAQLSTVPTGATTGTKVAVLGDFKKGFLIIDRIGIQIELIPHLFGAAQRFPTGQRGLYMYWRAGATTIGSGSAAGSPLRYLEIK